jgi:hypothetical protein
MRSLILVLITFTLFVNCDRVKSGSKKAINKGGEMVGETASEFIDGVDDGVTNTLKPTVEFSAELAERNITKGKYWIDQHPKGREKNILSIYLIFNQAVNDTLLAKAFDKEGLEIGRSTIIVSENAGDAAYFDFIFDPRTVLEAKSKIVLQLKSES